MVKTECEIGLLKSTAEVVNIAHKKLMELTQEAGKSEFEIWAQLTKARHQHVAGKLIVAGEVVCSPRNKTVSPAGQFIMSPSLVTWLNWILDRATRAIGRTWRTP